MGDYISRETLRDLMYMEAFERDTGLQRWDSGLWIRYKLFENCIESIPAADVVEVVRCRECKYRDYDDEPYGKKVAVCTGAMAYSNTPDDWYCPMGKRKDGGKDDG